MHYGERITDIDVLVCPAGLARHYFRVGDEWYPDDTFLHWAERASKLRDAMG